MASENEQNNRRLKLNILPENPQEKTPESAVALGRFPQWLHRQIPQGGQLNKTNEILRHNQLNTVCEEAKCPNRLECYSKGTATFLALGKECTRACGFCDIDFSKKPKPPEKDEPLRIANSVKQLKLKHVVITMVARDDLPDQGALHIATIIQAIKSQSPQVTIEILTSDFGGNFSALDIVLAEKPEIFNHNIETVARLTPKVRHKATYERTLSILSYVKKANQSHFIKSGIMVGLGENQEEVKETIRDLYQIGCDIITIGHYLQPNRNKIRVKEFISPNLFLEYERFGHEIGVPYMYCGPFVRSSYNADLLIKGKI